MSTTKSSLFISPMLIESVPTHVDAAARTSSDSLETDNYHAWQTLIDYQLIDWGRNPNQLDDEGVEPPSRETIQAAMELAGKLRDAGLAAPHSVVPDANGGIVFERRENGVTEVFHIWDDGAIEYQCFAGTRLIERRTL